MGLLGLRRFVDTSGCTRLLSWPSSSSRTRKRLSHRSSRRERVKRTRLSRTRAHVQDDMCNSTGSSNDDDADKSSSSNDGDDDDDDEAASHTAAAAHVLVDMNCIIHACFSRRDEDGAGGVAAAMYKTRQQLIHDVLEQLRVLLTRVVVPYKTLTLCLDGPAPLAKLCTQRLRRRKVGLMDSAGCGVASSERGHGGATMVSTSSSAAAASSSSSSGAAGQLNALSITAGSLFLVELENALAAQFRLRHGRGFLQQRCAVYLHGSTVAGEGEAKIARALAFIALAACNVDEEDDKSSSSNNMDVKDNRGTAAARSGDVHAAATAHKHHHSNRHATTTMTTTTTRQHAHHDNVYRGVYNPNDTVVVLGNDIDLVLTCLGATMYHNITLVSPSSLQATSIADILYRWVRQSLTARTSVADMTSGTAVTAAAPQRRHSGNNSGRHRRVRLPCAATEAAAVAAQRVIDALPSMRIDFIFLFLLNGGDHYTGAGEVALSLWTRYRALRSTRLSSSSSSSHNGSYVHHHYHHYHHRLVSDNLDAIDVDVLADVLQAREYDGDADVHTGLRLLQSALWALYMVVTGQCADYAYLPPDDAPQLAHLRAAAAWCVRQRIASLPRTRHGKQQGHTRGSNNNNNDDDDDDDGSDGSRHPPGSIRLRRVAHSLPLTPLETFVALMPTEATLPAGVAQTLRQPAHRALATALLYSNDTTVVATSARRAVALTAAASRLTPSEQLLRNFTTPVQLNVLPPPPPPRRVSRYELHRRRCAALRRAASASADMTPHTTRSSNNSSSRKRSGRCDKGGNDADDEDGAGTSTALMPMVQRIVMPETTACYLRQRLAPPSFFTYYSFVTPFDVSTTTAATTATTATTAVQQDKTRSSSSSTPHSTTHTDADAVVAARRIYVCGPTAVRDMQQQQQQRQSSSYNAAHDNNNSDDSHRCVTQTAANAAPSTRSVTQTVQHAMRQLLHTAQPCNRAGQRSEHTSNGADDAEDTTMSQYVSDRLQRLQARTEARLLREDELQQSAAHQLHSKASKWQLRQELRQFLGSAHDVAAVLRNDDDNTDNKSTPPTRRQKRTTSSHGSDQRNKNNSNTDDNSDVTRNANAGNNTTRTLRDGRRRRSKKSKSTTRVKQQPQQQQQQQQQRRQVAVTSRKK